MTDRSSPPLPTEVTPYPLTDALTPVDRVFAVTLWVGMMVSYGADNRVWVFPPIGSAQGGPVRPA